MKFLRATTGLLFVATAGLWSSGCGGDSTGVAAVASVQMSSTNSNPRVGDVTHVSATPQTSTGVTIPGVTCTFSSGTPGVATVTSDGTVTAVSVGSTIITGTCGGISNTITITVRPPSETLTLLSGGTGSGAVFASPAGGTYDQGTSVSISATANSGSTFTGFTGGGCGTTSPCTVVMDSNTTVTANFALSTTYATSATFGGKMSSVSDPSPPGCTYGITVTVLSMTFTQVGSTWTGTEKDSVNVTPTGQTGVGSCTGNPYTETATGTLTVNGSSVSGSLTHTSATYGTVNQTISITGTLSGTSITGTVNSALVLRNGAGTAFNSSGGPFSFSMTKQ